ncbi:TIGR02300 family protein [Aquibaculum arenosum]|uniref:TIGR02300 family protein n=1 Tax=Aquibaculum arenosum TaxID=3032591 RepID=A0ABT5YK36_9PROT|nr:TIGR02300 family protein [Fodinicurvata sp. CAU 1616]MDF2095223.1 TIGR02300 family protein [Fodinicurvata sp. CAU 1616]
MAKPEWGTKRMCQSCGAKFYDFSRSPILCPSCGATFDPETLLRSRRSKASPAKAKPKVEPVEAEEPEVEEAADELADIESESVIEDTDDLDGDEDLGKVSVDDTDKES